SLLGATLLADAAAAIATVAITFAFVGSLGSFLRMPGDIAAAAPWFAALHLFGQVHMTNVGILRLYDRVALIAAQHSAIAIARFAGALAILAASGDGADAIVAWGAANVVGGIVLWGGATSTLRREAVWPRLGAFSDFGARPREFMSFLSATNLIGTLEAGLHFAIISFVSASLGLADAGLFHLIRQLSDALARPAEFLAPLIFPEVAALKVRDLPAELHEFVWKATLGAACAVAPVVGLAAMLGGDLLTFVFEVDASSIGAALLLAILASALFVATFAIEPLMLTNGHSVYALLSHVAPWAVLAAVLCLFGSDAGLYVATAALFAHRAAQTCFRLSYLVWSDARA
ncbi:MAG: hypothetical protein AAFU55_01940, partial [Pseudomonadota bacterium]